MSLHPKPTSLEVVPAVPKLKAWMAGPPRITQEELVARLDAIGVSVSQQSVSNWLCSRSYPDGDLVKDALAVVTGGAVEAGDWRTEQEREARARFEQATASAATGTAA
jgi:hypothetical protein